MKTDKEQSILCIDIKFFSRVSLLRNTLRKLLVRMSAAYTVGMPMIIDLVSKMVKGVEMGDVEILEIIAALVALSVWAYFLMESNYANKELEKILEEGSK